MSSPLQEIKVSPEVFEVTTEYVKTLDLAQTAKALKMTQQEVVEVLDKREAKRYIDAIFLEQGYLNRNKLNDIMTELVELKLEEMRETGQGTSKDILEVLKFMHQMRMDHDKANKDNAPGTQVNIQQNYGGDNYSKLMERIVSGEK